MAKKKLSLQYSQISSDYLSSTAMRRLVRTMRRCDVEKERIPHMKLIIVAVWLYASRTDGFYALADEDFYDSIAEDTDIDDEEIKADIAWLAEHGYFHAEFFHRNIITSVDIQEAYFSTVGRMRREKPDLEDMKYVIIDIDNYFVRTKPPRILLQKDSSEESEDSSEGREDSSEGREDSSEGRGDSSYSNSSRIVGKEYKEVVRSCSSTRIVPYTNDENYNFYIIFFMMDVSDPATEVERFIAYNETRGWENKNAKYDTPRKRVSLAEQFAQKNLTKKGRLKISGLEEGQKELFKQRVLQFLFQMYLYYQAHTSFTNYSILNPNTQCQFIPQEGSQFSIKLFVGPRTAEQLKTDYQHVMQIGRETIGIGLQEIEFCIASRNLQTITPKK